jgi:hypothetical protein
MFLDSFGIVSTFVDTQIVFVGESSSARWTGKGSLVDRQMCGEMDGEGGLTDGSLGAKMAHVDAGSVVRHGLGTEAASGWVSEFVGVVEMASERETVGEPFDAQGTLVDVREMCLYVEGSLEGIVRPVGAIGTGVATAESQGLGLMHTLGEGDE